MELSILAVAKSQKMPEVNSIQVDTGWHPNAGIEHLKVRQCQHFIPSDWDDNIIPLSAPLTLICEHLFSRLPL